MQIPHTGQNPLDSHLPLDHFHLGHLFLPFQVFCRYWLSIFARGVGEVGKPVQAFEERSQIAVVRMGDAVAIEGIYWSADVPRTL